jgi:DNA-binding winged helix-turn-helix (wHTH) protein
MAAVWPDVEVEDNNLTVRMSSLRRALGERKGHHPYIQTVSGRGYCLIVQVKEIPAEPTADMVTNVQAPVAAVTSATEITNEQSVPSRSAVARRMSEIRGFRLYALLVVGLLSNGRP